MYVLLEDLERWFETEELEEWKNNNTQSSVELSLGCRGKGNRLQTQTIGLDFDQPADNNKST